ncbi:MAG: MoxR family ATPase, partial [Symploca sp. SIO3E6]|nr:MoxR family ATPase [Caldora sp. SIO3E6]
MDNLAQRLYTGKGDCHYKPLPKAWQEPEPYIAPQSLVDAVNTALYLRRPLLLEGDPGCGKTRLAYAVAYELGYPLHPCYIRSTSRAQDLLYDYDALGRLYDIQEGKVGDNLTQAPSRQEYVTLGELGHAIAQSQSDIPSVVLIDEIDKADIDFPNDLLLELDRLQFQVKEVPQMRYDALQGKTRKARRDFLPLIIITSNREKELPKPFLRRCLFYYIEFPDQNTLKQILQSHFQPKLTPLFEVAVNKFWELRELRSWRKIPGTSEFLDWVAILAREQQGKKLTAEKLASTDLVNLPYLETLVKTQSD